MPVAPVIRDDETAPFLEGTAQGQFLLRYCPHDHASSPHAHVCDTCGAGGLIWMPASGAASVVSWAVVPGRPSDAGPGNPTVLVVAELAEGPWWWSQVTGADPHELSTGACLTISFEQAGEEHESIPIFVLA